MFLLYPTQMAGLQESENIFFLLQGGPCYVEWIPPDTAQGWDFLLLENQVRLLLNCSVLKSSGHPPIMTPGFARK